MFERNGEAMLAPLEGDVLRWMDGYVEHRGRALKIESETGHELAGAAGAWARCPSGRSSRARAWS